MEFEVGDRVKNARTHAIHTVMDCGNIYFRDENDCYNPIYMYKRCVLEEPADPVLDYKIALAEEFATDPEQYGVELFESVALAQDDLMYEIYCMASLMSGVFEPTEKG